MKVRILIRQKIEGEAGTIAEVDPARASFLIAYGAAEPAEEIREQVETPEKAVPAARKAPAKKTEQKTEQKTTKSAKRK